MPTFNPFWHYFCPQESVPADQAKLIFNPPTHPVPILTRIPITSHRFAWLIPLFFLWGMRVPLLAQCALTCNDGLQVPLDPTGRALITTQLIAPNAGSSCPGSLTVTLFNNFGQVIANPLTCAQIGQTVTVQVKHTASGNFCTGTLEVFDALPPVLSNCAEKFIFCNEDPAPEVLGLPIGTDNCTTPSNVDFTYIDDETALGCGNYQNGQAVLKRIDRSWTASDEHGNTSTCQQTIWLKHISVVNVTFPPNLDNLASPALVCGQDPNDLALTGQPTVNGIPVGASPECEIAATFSDQTINHCAPAGFTVLRNWTIVDFCSGAITNRTQIIKVEDKEAPTLVAPDDFTVGTDGFYCTGTVTMPQAIFSDNCSSVNVVPSWIYGSGYGPFTGVPEGQHIVKYTATDGCGNTATATMLVTVEDTSPPQAICSADLQISISSNGVGYVNTLNIDAGSYDNCGPVFLSISRDEVEYMPQIPVTCADQGAPILFTLRVLDAAGLENFCQMEVTVRDFLKPTVQCPSNRSLTCLQDYTYLSLTGQATATDNCALKSLVHQDIVNIQPCNIGSVTRWWIATDSAGNTKSCSQQITVNVVNTTTVTFPANSAVTGCGSPASILPTATGEPIFGGLSCSPLSINYTDQIFSIAPPSCFRIFRAWKVVDHCVYNPNGGVAGIWEQTQIIDVVDHTPPELSLPADLTVGADPINCLGSVALPNVTATDCSNQITLTHDSNFSGAGNTNNASGQYPLGVHLVTFTAEDGCGNAAQKTLKITVKDLTPPNAVCLTGVSVQIQASGTVTLNPLNFDGGCSDFCSPQNSLNFTITPSVFDCQQTGLFPITLTVQDPSGNIANCTTQVLVQDNANNCGGNGGLEHQVEGSIRTETGLPVNNILVTISSDGFIESTDCDTTGYFGFSDVPTGDSYVLKPFNNANWTNGMTTFDLVLISKHILGTEPFNSPYKMLAADANLSGSITTFDVVQFRKVILGILDSLPTNTSWRFIDSSFVFPNQQNPFSTPVPEIIVFDPLVSNQSGQNFVGIKVGDVNGSTNPAIARAPQDTLLMTLADCDFKSGESFAVPVLLKDWTTLEGLQFELRVDPLLVALERVEFAQPALLGQQNIAVKPDGLISASWDNAGAEQSGYSKTDPRLFTLHLRGKAHSDVRSAVQISSSRLAPEAYRVENEDRAAISLGFETPGLNIQNAELEIYPNPSLGDFFVKNPFAGTFSSLRILDCLGQVVWEEAGYLPETVAVRGMTFSQQGLYFLELKSAAGAVSGKVLIVK